MPLRKDHFRNIEFEDHYNVIAGINLIELVPEKIQDHFTTAKNILVYSWHVYRFVQVAELHAYSGVEFALRTRLIQEGLIEEKKHIKLAPELKKAIKRGWIKNEEYSQYVEEKEYHERKYQEEMRRRYPDFDFPEYEYELKNYAEIFAKSIPFFRNTLAHGSSMVKNGGYNTLKICAETINQICSN